MVKLVVIEKKKGKVKVSLNALELKQLSDEEKLQLIAALSLQAELVRKEILPVDIDKEKQKSKKEVLPFNWDKFKKENVVCTIVETSF